MLNNIEKKINNHHIVWFGQSNRWIQIEEPAWFVNRLFQKGIDSCTIQGKFSRKYNLPRHECRRFVDEICASITELSNPVTVSYSKSNYSSFPSDYSFVPYSCRYYLIADKCFSITYETLLAEYYIHPPLAHLEIRYSETAHIQFELLNNENIAGLREKNNPRSTLTFEDFNRLKNRLFINIINAVYHKTNDDWMSFVHSSAVTNGRQTILLSSDCGSGKSTMAALLLTRGLQLISDDFVPIDAKNKYAFPFPAAISVKEGAFDLLNPFYGDLQNINFNNYEYTHRSVRYLSPNYLGKEKVKANPVKNIVFIHYNPMASCDFKLLPPNEALKLFHEQAWVSCKFEHAKAFLNWFIKLKCYSLEYGNTEEGINKILGLFE